MIKNAELQNIKKNIYICEILHRIFHGWITKN